MPNKAPKMLSPEEAFRIMNSCDAARVVNQILSWDESLVFEDGQQPCAVDFLSVSRSSSGILPKECRPQEETDA